jgi:hypothetical protein
MGAERTALAGVVGHVGRARRAGIALAAALVALAACSSDPAGSSGPPDPDPALVERRVLPDTISLEAFVDSLAGLMPGRDSQGYDPPGADERGAMLAILAHARAGRVDLADSLARPFRYDIETTVERGSGDSLVVLVERGPILHGWGTYVLRPGGVPADVHVDHPLFDVNTPRVAAGLFNECRCRAYLMAGTHRYANAGDESDMARSTSSLFQEPVAEVQWPARMALARVQSRKDDES